MYILENFYWNITDFDGNGQLDHFNLQEVMASVSNFYRYILKIDIVYLFGPGDHIFLQNLKGFFADYVGIGTTPSPSLFSIYFKNNRRGNILLARHSEGKQKFRFYS